MTGSLKYVIEDIAVLAALRQKWQGQQQARSGKTRLDRKRNDLNFYPQFDL